MFVPVVEQSTIATRLKHVKEIASDPFDLRHDWLVEHQLKVLPIPTGGHFSDDQSRRLARAFRSEGCEHLMAIATEEMIDDPWLYELDASAKDIMQFSFTCGANNFALLPQADGNCGALCTVNDYALLFGAKNFLDEFLSPITIPEAQEEFRKVYDSYRKSNQHSLEAGLKYVVGASPFS